jgi:FkbM family methyltransferase
MFSQTAADHPCSAPSPECIAQVRDFVNGDERGGFWVERSRALKHLTALLPSILTDSILYGNSLGRENVSRPVMIDFGAGMYGKENSSDDSDALALLAGFRNKVDIFAFEARPDKAAELRREALRRGSTAAYAARRLHVYAAAAGDRPGQLRFAHCGGTTDWMVVIEGEEPRKGCKIKYEVPVSSLDELERTGVLKNRRIAYVKVDVEGNELAVAKGMRGLLARRAIDLMSFEYAKFWNPPMYEDAQAHSWRRISAKQLEAFYSDPAMRERTLEAFQASMGRFGYDTYLLHGGPAVPRQPLKLDDGPHNTPWRATIVPAYAPFFERSMFEICLRRHHFKQDWCWNDLLVVRRDHYALKRRLFSVLHGGRQGNLPSETQAPFTKCDARCL